jgi:hypothetical protein
MTNPTIVTPADLATLAETGIKLHRGSEFRSDTPTLFRIFGHAPLGRVLVLAVDERKAGTLVYWQ